MAITLGVCRNKWWDIGQIIIENVALPAPGLMTVKWDMVEMSTMLVKMIVIKARTKGSLTLPPRVS